MLNLTIDDFNRLYWDDKLSYRAVANKLNISCNKLRAWINKHRASLKLRTRREAIKLAALEGRYEKAGINNPNWIDGRQFEQGRHRCYNYGLTQIAYDSMLEEHNGKCAICNNTFSGTPHIDHNHTTGEVRGLLCNSCNTGLGMFKDNIEFLASAIKYLR